jgi:hypothetical protein
LNLKPVHFSPSRPTLTSFVSSGATRKAFQGVARQVRLAASRSTPNAIGRSSPRIRHAIACGD